ncbi:amidase [Paraburkholderia sp. BL27I4N3]|uniref:amidase n=1 Tax=Paraburkholderia sp. BL27I4N3 TaxID=1938805 RepID=UPI000E3746F8|nr:amidase [Paraburkholderia sp. BL27I4N3]REE07482.1 amidase [Paraburkholderia sp. BL27I4N3]
MSSSSLLPFGSAANIANAIRNGFLSSREALEHFIGRLDSHNASLNAVVTLRLDEARAEADAADRARQRGGIMGPLHGVPMTVKESFRLAGTPTTWGLEKFAHSIPTDDAVAVRRLKEAGAVIFGKTNVPVLLADWQTFNPVYGTTNNPWDVARSPGGSSGGAAAAIAAGLTGLELGTDIGASIRNPAHYCGVYGHKPTFGIVSQSGHALPDVVSEPDMGVIGPLARSASDLALVLGVISGPADIANRGWRLDLPAPRKTELSAFRVAFLFDAPNAPVDTEVAQQLQKLADFLRDSGVQVTENAWPNFDRDEMYRLYVRLLRSTTSRNHTSAEVLRFREEVGTRFADTDDYWWLAREAAAMGHRDWLLLNELRHRIRMKWAAFFQDFDVLVCPAASTTAVTHDHSLPRHERRITINGEPVQSIHQMFWASMATLAYLPATVAPIGVGNSGLPVGVQIIGAQYDDHTTIEFARLLETQYQAFTAPPAFAA